MLVVDNLNDEQGTYTALALRTASPLAGRLEIMHALLGIVCETLESINLIDGFVGVEELTQEQRTIKLLAELGDIAWFICLFYWFATDHDEEQTEKTLEELFEPRPHFKMDSALVPHVTHKVEQLASLIKSELAYGKLVTVGNVEPLIVQISMYVATLMHVKGFSTMQVFSTNIAKLAIRYRNAKFSAAARAVSVEVVEEQIISEVKDKVQ